uniref:Uncharacterized protein n=1 Tax=Arundo donax TaxID=35708 RepID=A0A0A9C5K8_ARUDO
MANLITGVTSIVMVILIAVYIILVFVTFKNVRVGLASACSIIIAPFYIFGLVVLKDQRDIFIERFALSPRKNANGCNPSSANM